MPADAPGVRTAALLLRMGRRESTWESYDSKLARWAHFCTEVWPRDGRPPLPVFPAKQEHILAYLGFLCEEDKVHASSL